MKTNNFQFDLLAQNQSQKELTINNNIYIMDLLLNTYVKSIKFSSPGDLKVTRYLYIVGDDAKGLWQGKENHIAYQRNKVWQFIKPQIGMLFYVYDEGRFYAYTENGWEKAL